MLEYRLFAPQRAALYHIVFGVETKAGRLFDLVLIYAILTSVLLVMVDSFTNLSPGLRVLIKYAELGFTLIFTVEYFLRIFISPRPLSYMRSFFGIIDLLSILPTYLAFLFPGAEFLLVVRLVRVLRIFRVLKLLRYMDEARYLMAALRTSQRKILVFFMFVVVLSTIFGSLVFLLEGPEHGFTSIPRSIYWAIITITTVGYGDIVPQTHLGQAIAAIVTLMGYAIIAVPTGIITAEISLGMIRKQRVKCRECEADGHQEDSRYCRVCGTSFVQGPDQPAGSEDIDPT